LFSSDIPKASEWLPQEDAEISMRDQIKHALAIGPRGSLKQEIDGFAKLNLGYFANIF
jgi:hypothetical protein